MILHPAEQGSIDWMVARSGIPTASEFDALLTPAFEIRKGEMPKTYVAKKLAEAWLGGPLAGFNVFDVEQGQILEEEARPWFECDTGIEVKRVGLCLTDDGRAGCSPDGLIGDDNGIEIKCPAVHTHVGYLLSGVLPKDYAAQVHGSLYITGRPRWTFLSYCRRFPALVLTIERDEEVMEKIEEALEGFREQFDAGWEKLVAANGGPPKRTPKPAHPAAAPDAGEDGGITP